MNWNDTLKKALLKTIYALREAHLESCKRSMSPDGHSVHHMRFSSFLPYTLEADSKRSVWFEHRAVLLNTHDRAYARFRTCDNKRGDYLQKYALQYYQRKFALHHFYCWKLQNFRKLGLSLCVRQPSPSIKGRHFIVLHDKNIFL